MQDTINMSQLFEEAYTNLTARIDVATEVETELTKAEGRLEHSRNAILRTTEPKELGSNEAQREARIAEQCMAELLDMQRLEEQRIGVRAEVEKARLQVDLLRNRLRLMEIAASVRAA